MKRWRKGEGKVLNRGHAAGWWQCLCYNQNSVTSTKLRGTKWMPLWCRSAPHGEALTILPCAAHCRSTGFWVSATPRQGGSTAGHDWTDAKLLWWPLLWQRLWGKGVGWASQGSWDRKLTAFSVQLWFIQQSPPLFPVGQGPRHWDYWGGGREDLGLHLVTGEVIRLGVTITVSE